MSGFIEQDKIISGSLVFAKRAHHAGKIVLTSPNEKILSGYKKSITLSIAPLPRNMLPKNFWQKKQIPCTELANLYI
jgi:hypothetical protein